MVSRHCAKCRQIYNSHNNSPTINICSFCGFDNDQELCPEKKENKKDLTSEEFVAELQLKLQTQSAEIHQLRKTIKLISLIAEERQP